MLIIHAFNVSILTDGQQQAYVIYTACLYARVYRKYQIVYEMHLCQHIYDNDKYTLCNDRYIRLMK